MSSDVVDSVDLSVPDTPFGPVTLERENLKFLDSRLDHAVNVQLSLSRQYIFQLRFGGRLSRNSFTGSCLLN